VNKLTLVPGCEHRIGRADIEESKSGIALNAPPPQASYPCGNFSDTSRRKKRVKCPYFFVKDYSFSREKETKISEDIMYFLFSKIEKEQSKKK